MLLYLTIFVSAAFAQVLVKPFNAVIKELEQAPEYQSHTSTIRAIELDFDSRELVLQPTVEVAGRRTHDRREQLSSTTTRKPRLDTIGVVLRKPFGTGTSVEIGPSWEQAFTPSLAPDHRTTANWQVAISQSLWRDGFGRSTRLRRAREDYQRKQQLAAARFKQAEMLVDFETLFWDWSYTLRQSELQEKNLKRSREILRWVQDRFSRSAAESTDLLQAKALLAQRELQVAALRLNLTQIRTRIERYLPGHFWQPELTDLQVERTPEALVWNWKADTLPTTTLLQYLESYNLAMASREAARESREAIRPDVNLEFSYGKNAIDPDNSIAIRHSYEKDSEHSTVGLVFRSGLDFGSERRKVESARATQVAAEQRLAARDAENKVAWEQLKREISDLQLRIKTATELVDLQTRKANAERERYRKGRSTAFQAITFEQEASEAEITLWQLYALMRKTEARARLFAR